MKAQLNQCQKCSKAFLHFDMVQKFLCTWRKCATPLPSINKEAAWLCQYQLDITAYTYAYHIKHGCAEESVSSDSVWKDAQIRSVLKQMRFDEHRYRHTKSCWKKGHVCRFGSYTWSTNPDTSWVFEDKGLPRKIDRSIV